MATSTPPTDQRAGVRPISFVLDNLGAIGNPVTLVVRPEDLTRNEPSRITVHQTLGRGDTSGWADNFGEGLPSVTIAGHTGWGGGGRPDGVDTFAELNQLVAHEYHAAKQDAIDMGADPALVKLLFIDMLDDFSWSVAPMQFVLRRSRSRPLLFQYNITLQAASTAIDNPLVLPPQGAAGLGGGNVPAGLAALSTSIGKIESFADRVRGMVASAVGFVRGIASTVKAFVDKANGVFKTARDVISEGKGAVSAVTNSLIDIARDVASVGTNVFRTLSSIRDIPAFLKAELGQVAGAFNEVKCIFANSLKGGKAYEDYDALNGASNCSSTTGGRFPSIYAGRNAFEAMSAPAPSPVIISSTAGSSMSTLSRMDPVMAPMAIPEMNRHMIAVVNGVGA